MIKEYGYEYDAVLNQRLWEMTKGKTVDKKIWGAYCLRSGRDALKVIARENYGVTVLLPALSCDSMILPFELYDCNISFYRLQDNLHADLVHVKELLDSTNGIKVLLYNDYFGIEMIHDDFLVDIKNEYGEKIVLVRDITHTFLCEGGPSELADYTLVSLRKWTNIPDGGLLWSKSVLKNQVFGNDLSFFEKRLNAQILRNEFFKTSDLQLKDQYRRIFSTVSNILNEDVNPSKMSEYAYNLINQTDWMCIREQRMINARELIGVLSQIEGVQLIQSDITKSNLYVPFIVQSRDDIQSKLSELGVFNTVIWPLRTEQKECCSVSKYIEEHMLAAPCDQRYSKEDMIYIGREIERAIHA